LSCSPFTVARSLEKFMGLKRCARNVDRNEQVSRHRALIRRFGQRGAGEERGRHIERESGRDSKHAAPRCSGGVASLVFAHSPMPTGRHQLSSAA
jgi:hypothetical protein